MVGPAALEPSSTARKGKGREGRGWDEGGEPEVCVQRPCLCEEIRQIAHVFDIVGDMVFR